MNLGQESRERGVGGIGKVLRAEPQWSKVSSSFPPPFSEKEIWAESLGKGTP